MKIYDIENGIMIYYLPEELDHYAADKIRRKSDRVFEETEVKNLIFDFKNTCFMDSSGIGLITGRYRKIHDAGGKAYIVNVKPGIDRVLKMSGIYRIIGKWDSKEDIINELIKGGYYE
jgi:stage II sporulation protein AA (anti-sigma F factor antagonist)